MQYIRFLKLSYLYLLSKSVLNLVIFLKKYNTFYIQLFYKTRYFVNNAMYS